MQSRIEMSRDELTALVRAVMNYNGKEPVSIGFVDTEGQAIEIGGVHVLCEEPGLKVRVVPEESEEYTPADVARFFSGVNPANAASN